MLKPITGGLLAMAIALSVSGCSKEQPATPPHPTPEAPTSTIDVAGIAKAAGGKTVAEGTNDLTVTTTGTLPNVGDTVLLTGPVVLNKDFGMGYRYDVMVEDALFKVEGNGG